MHSWRGRWPMCTTRTARALWMSSLLRTARPVGRARRRRWRGRPRSVNIHTRRWRGRPRSVNIHTRR
jgi:hypothetical protein